MAKDFSFDVVSEVDLQEVDNAVNQAIKEMRNRYDFKGSQCELKFSRGEKQISLLADNDLHMNSLTEMLHAKCTKRGVSVRSLKYQPAEKAMDGLIRQKAEIAQGIPQDMSKEMVKKIKSLKLKVQSSIQGEQVRISSKSKDDLQGVIEMLKGSKFDIPIQFINYR